MGRRAGHPAGRMTPGLASFQVRRYGLAQALTEPPKALQVISRAKDVSHPDIGVEAETFQTPKPRCGTKEAKAAERSTRAGFSGSAKPATEIVEADVHA